MTIKLNKPFTANSPADEDDVRLMKRALNWLGYYTPYEKTGISAIPDAAVFRALQAFQDDQGLSATGKARPDDDTVKALDKALSRKLEGKG